ncbi:hypothetical protein SDC9_200256 [bioreactor metagenome]|uniref:Uncharacterized protein n=1 Tax=bioreactor metagenome TaxID=1076179 RepID=A0A645IW22_9ZZZZ
MCFGFSCIEFVTVESKLWTSKTASKRPSSSIPAIYPPTPPSPKLPRRPFSFIYSPRYFATARLAPPTPIWKEKPGSSIPEAFIRRKESLAIFRSTGFFVILAAPVAIFFGSPRLSTHTMLSTRYCGIEILGLSGYSTRLSVIATTCRAYLASVIA